MLRFRCKASLSLFHHHSDETYTLSFTTKEEAFLYFNKLVKVGRSPLPSVSILLRNFQIAIPNPHTLSELLCSEMP